MAAADAATAATAAAAHAAAAADAADADDIDAFSQPPERVVPPAGRVRLTTTPAGGAPAYCSLLEGEAVPPSAIGGSFSDDEPPSLWRGGPWRTSLLVPLRPAGGGGQPAPWGGATATAAAAAAFPNRADVAGLAPALPTVSEPPAGGASPRAAVTSGAPS